MQVGSSRQKDIRLGSSGWLDEYIKEYERDPDFIAEGMAIQVIEDAIRAMNKRGISRSDLASLIGVSRAYVTRVFNAPPNLTLRSVAQLALALDLTPEVRLTEPASAVQWVPALATSEQGFLGTANTLIVHGDVIGPNVTFGGTVATSEPIPSQLAFIDSCAVTVGGVRSSPGAVGEFEYSLVSSASRSQEEMPRATGQQRKYCPAAA